MGIVFAAICSFTGFIGQSFELTKTYQQSIGLAMLAGVDAPKRQTVYFGLLLLFAVTFFVGEKLVRVVLEKLAQQRTLDKYALTLDCMTVGGLGVIVALVAFFSQKKLLVALAGAVGIGLLPYLQKIIAKIKNTTQHAKMRKTLCTKLTPDKNVLGWLLVFIAASVFARGYFGSAAEPVCRLALGLAIGHGVTFGIRKIRGKTRPDDIALRKCGHIDDTAAYFILLAMLLFTVVVVLTNSPDSPVALFGVRQVSIAIVAAMWLAASYIREQLGDNQRLITAGAPLALLPLLYLTSAELQYFLSKWHIVATVTIFYCAIIGGIIASILIEKFVRPRRSKTLLRYWYYPLMLATLYIAALWSAQTTLYANDLLHPGNILVPGQQLYQYGVLPYLDHWPGQGAGMTLLPFLSNLFYGRMGSYGEGAMIWHPFLATDTIRVLLVYFILARMLHPSLGCLLAILIGGYGGYYGVALLPILALPWALRTFSFGRITCVWILAVAAFTWMPSAGKGTTLGLLLFYLIYTFKKWKWLTIALSSFATVYGLTAFVYFALVYLLGRHSIHDVAIQIAAYGNAELAIGSYPWVAAGKSLFAFWYYAITPLIFLGTCIYCFRLRAQNKNIDTPCVLALVVATISLFLHTRALSRHCLIETYHPIFIFLQITLLLLAVRKKLHFPVIAYLLPLVVIAPMITESTGKALPLTIASHQWDAPRPDRVNTVIPDEIKQVVDFMRDNLEDKETFVELVNGHLLYFLTNKPFPFFQCSPQLMQSLPPQSTYIRDMQKLYDKGTAPLLVMANDPNVWMGAAIDGIPSSQALFRLSEYIYSRYVPYVSVGSFELWAAKNSRFASQQPGDFHQGLAVSQVHDWGELVRVWAKNLLPAKGIRKDGDPSEGTVTISSPKNIVLSQLDDLENGRYLVFNVAAGAGGVLYGEMKQGDHVGRFSFNFQASTEPVPYMIPVKALYAGALLPETATVWASQPAEVYLKNDL